MPPRDLGLSLDAQRWGLRCSTVEGDVWLMQLSGGGRLRLRCGEREWWARPPLGVTWEVAPSSSGQTYPTRESAVAVAERLSR